MLLEMKELATRQLRQGTHMKVKNACTLQVLLLALAPFGYVWSQSKEGSSFDQSKFVPDIALIMDVSTVGRDIANEKYFSLAIPGFDFPFSREIGSYASNAHRGMNFNYAELSLSSVVDPYFDLFAVIDLAPEGANIEEAYFSTRKLPYGLKLKVGKFLASFGRINEQHEHFWDFANRPLIAGAMFGEDGLNEIGLLATWVPPTPFYLTFGAEVLNGANAESFGTTGISDAVARIAIDPVQGPNLYIGFVRSSIDIGEAAVLFGLSNAFGTTRTDEGFSSLSYSGKATDENNDIVGGDVTVKYSLDAIRYLSLQTEYMYRTSDGTEYARDSLNAASSIGMEKHHSGFYAQVVAKVDQLWRVGVRWDRLLQNDISLAGTNQIVPGNLVRTSAMIEYSPSEFSRLRLQVDRDLSRYSQRSGGWSQEPYTQVILQANLVIGAHGAHAF